LDSFVKEKKKMSNTSEFFKACEYFEALINWVRTYPSASYKAYIQTRDKLRKEFNVEFIEGWRKRECHGKLK